MTLHNLLGIVADANVGMEIAQCKTVKHGQFTALLGRTKLLNGLSRKAAAKDAIARLKTLESLDGHGTVIPALPGVTITKPQVSQFLQSNASELTNIANTLRGRSQFTIRISCDTSAAIEKINWENLPFACMVSAEGFLLEFQKYVASKLLAVSEETYALPIKDDVVFNGVYLVENKKIPLLEKALEEIDAIWSDGLRIQQIGPSPCVSFSSIGVRRISAKTVRSCQKILGVSDGVSLDELYAQRRRALIESAGESQQEIKAAFSVLQSAIKCGHPNGPFLDLFVWAEGRSNLDSQADLMGAA